MQINSVSFSEELRKIQERAGEILLAYFKGSYAFHEKREGGLVTDADLASEKFLIDELSKLLPQAAFHSEESGKSGTGDYCWVIDPLDGTTNFAHGIPFFCISVALTFKDDPIIASIYDPLREEFFYAEKGERATLNGKPIKVASPDLKNQRLLIGLPIIHNEPCLKLLTDLGVKNYSARYFGAAALECAYVACGRLDAILFNQLAWWDIAAGMLLIQEAGGIVTDFEGNQVREVWVSFVGGSLKFATPVRPERRS